MGGSSAADTITGATGNEYLYGLDGNDSLTGNAGNDIFFGGRGNDFASGGDGDDTFILNKSEGVDTITGGLGNDTVAFGAGITFSNITLSRVGQTFDLLVGLPGGTSILIKEAFSWNAVELYKFLDGTSKSLSDMAIATTARAGTDGNDTIYGFNENEAIYAKKGNDYIDAGDGNDTITVNQGDGLDTIIGGGGNDVLKFGPDVAYSNLKFTGDGNSTDLTITVPGGGKIFAPGFFSMYATETLKFNDGSQKTINDVKQTITSSAGTIGNDRIYGFDTNDTITGGKGNDYMEGGYGDDTFKINQGDGIDTIEGFVGNDTVVFGSGITFASLQLSHTSTNELLAKLPGGGSLALWKSYGGEIENYKFQSDTHTYTAAELKNKAMAQAATSGNDSIVGFSYNDDIINGLAGNDTLYGDWGNDTLTGGAGIDKLTGDLGLDVYDFNTLSESTKKAADTITDFNTADDRIDVRGLGFTGIVSGAATGTKLGYTYDSAANDTIVTATTNFKIILDGHLTLDATDFIFS
ncbi:MAG: calcium-binding protein [Rickettsiales bacterium]